MKLVSVPVAALLALLAVLATGMSAAFAQGPSGPRTIYLTFDDGPLPGSEDILDVLQSERVPGTLFMVGMHAEASAARMALVARAKATPLVAVGNHSYSHANNRYREFYSDTERVVADMLKANKVLGLKTPVNARMPGRDVFRLLNVSKDDISVNAAQYERELVDYEFVAATGFLLFGWDFEWVHDGTGKPVQSVATLLSEIDHLFAYGRFVKPRKMIVLMHDEMFQDQFDGKTKLKALIDGLRQRGYVFGSLDDYDN